MALVSHVIRPRGPTSHQPNLSHSQVTEAAAISGSSVPRLTWNGLPPSRLGSLTRSDIDKCAPLTRRIHNKRGSAALPSPANTSAGQGRHVGTA